MSRSKILLLSFTSGLLLFLSWPHTGFAPLIFIALVPLLLIEEHYYLLNVKRSGRRVFWNGFLTFFIWNASTTWWIWNASPGGAVMAILVNSLLMSFIFLFYHRSKKRLGSRYAPLILISYWITFEFVHMHWDLSWTWLTLGNVFAKSYNMVQWYEYTGVFGGSLWVLGANLLITSFFLNYRERSGRVRSAALISALIVVPVLLSLLLPAGTASVTTSSAKDVVVVQPNIDPYNEKFSGNYKEQLDRMIQLAETRLDSNTDYLVMPETALQEGMWEDQFATSYSINTLKDLVKKFPRLNIIVGASTFKAFQPGEPLSPTARKFKEEDLWYDDYNTALQINTAGIGVYHKSILVPGVEKMPFPEVFGPLEDLALKMGGTSGSLGIQKERTVFFSSDKHTGAAPVICYESVYGEFVAQYVRNGASLICIITNDGWWGDTPGYHQHLAYASLRAIETRRCIARSANTGISCFINERGEPSQLTNWWEEAVIKARLPVSTVQTFYVRFGDYIAYAASILTCLLVLAAFYLRWFRKDQ